MAAITTSTPLQRLALRWSGLAWQVRRLLRLAGPSASAGLACIVLAALAQWQTAALTTRHLALAHQLSAQLSAQLSTNTAIAKLAAAPVDGSAAAIAAFHARLPAQEMIPGLLQELIRVAQQSGVTLNQAVYKPETDDNSGLLRYRITLPLRADATQVQTFLIAALGALPTLTLDAVTFQRARIESADVEARIEFVLLVRQPERP